MNGLDRCFFDQRKLRFVTRICGNQECPRAAATETSYGATVSANVSLLTLTCYVYCIKVKVQVDVLIGIAEILFEPTLAGTTNDKDEIFSVFKDFCKEFHFILIDLLKDFLKLPTIFKVRVLTFEITTRF